MDCNNSVDYELTTIQELIKECPSNPPSRGLLARPAALSLEAACGNRSIEDITAIPAAYGDFQDASTSCSEKGIFPEELCEITQPVSSINPAIF